MSLLQQISLFNFNLIFITLENKNMSQKLLLYFLMFFLKKKKTLKVAFTGMLIYPFKFSPIVPACYYWSFLWEQFYYLAPQPVLCASVPGPIWLCGCCIHSHWGLRSRGFDLDPQSLSFPSIYGAYMCFSPRQEGFKLTQSTLWDSGLSHHP